MIGGTKWTNINRAEFLNRFVDICEVSLKLLNTVKCATNYMIGENDFTEVISCDAYGYEYEFDTKLGCYRFRDKKEGPWTLWRSLEGA